jgi:Sec-independent protein translocase protein TatA
MSAIHILIVVLIVLLLVGLPNWGIAPQQWGYYPSGGIGLVVLVLVILLLLGRL